MSVKIYLNMICKNQGNFIDDLVDWIAKLFDPKDSKKTPSQKGQGGKSPIPFNVSTLKLLLSVIGVAVLIWGLSGFFLVQESEQAVILRFGKMDRIETSGLHWHAPYPIEKRLIEKVAVVNKIENVVHAGPLNKIGDGADQTLVLTGDENMVHVQYTVLWKIKDVKSFLFTAFRPQDTIKVAAESAVREVIGQTTARLVLTEGRDKIGFSCQELLQKLLDTYQLGIQIISFQLQRVDPPAAVVDAFNDMQASRIDADRSQKEAEAYANSAIPKARGESEKMKKHAEAISEKTIVSSQAEASAFESLLASYEKSPDIAKAYIKTELIKKRLKDGKKVIVDEKLSSHTLPHLSLNSK